MGLSISTSALINPFMVYAKNLTLLTSGAPSDLATITVPIGRYRIVGSAGTNSGSYIITESQTGSPAAGTIAIYDGPGATGFNSVAAIAPAGSGSGVALPPVSPSAFLGGTTLYVRQTANSANSAVISVYIMIHPYT